MASVSQETKDENPQRFRQSLRAFLVAKFDTKEEEKKEKETAIFVLQLVCSLIANENVCREKSLLHCHLRGREEEHGDIAAHHRQHREIDHKRQSPCKVQSPGNGEGRKPPATLQPRNLFFLCLNSQYLNCATKTQKNPFSVRKIFARNSGAGNGCTNFMDARLEKCLRSAGKTYVHKIPRFGGGGILGLGGGGTCRFCFYGREDFSEKPPFNRFQQFSGLGGGAGIFVKSVQCGKSAFSQGNRALFWPKMGHFRRFGTTKMTRALFPG